MTRALSLFSLSLVWLAACGAGEQNGDDDLDPGFTACGDTTCSPGQYCFADGLCENGCTSDVNCLPSDRCVIDDDLFDEGQCVPREPVDTGSSQGNTLQGCLDACDHFQSCGLPVSEASQCRNDCNDLTENQQIAVANCDGLSCISTRECLGIECFDDDDCNGGTSCIGNVCL